MKKYLSLFLAGLFLLFSTGVFASDGDPVLLPGSTDITTVGTIGTGVWQGTAIADTYISSAATWNAGEPGDADLTAIAALACTENQIIKRNGAGAWVCAADADSGGSTAINAIGDAAADGTIDQTGYKQIFTSTLNAAGSVWTFTNTTADLTSDVSFMDFIYTDDGDANGFFLRGYDNATDLKWSIGLDGAAIFGTITGTTVKFTGGTPGAGKVLTSDADGDATWETPGTGAVATDAIWDAEGDLVQGTGPDASAKITKGAEGTILRAGASTNAYSTSTFADTYAKGTFLHAGTANIITGLAPGAVGSFLMSNGTGEALTYLAPGTANYMLVGAGVTTIPVWTASTGTGSPVLSASPTFTGTVILPKTLEIQDTSADHQYVLAVSELTADRTVTLPLLTGADEFVFKDHIQTLTNKTLTSPKLNEDVAVTTTATKLNYLTSVTGTTGTASTSVVFSTSPTLTTPVLGVATATSINGVVTGWTSTVGTFTAAPASTSTLTMTTDLTATILVGYPLKYKIGASYFYGIATAVASNLLTVAGTPLSADVTELYYGDPNRVRQVTYDNSSSTSVITTGTIYTLRWSLPKAYLVQAEYYQTVHDTHATHGKLTVKIAGTETNTSAEGIVIAADATWYSTVIDMAVAAVDVNKGEDVTIYATQGGNVNGYGARVNMIFVTP